MAERPRLGNMAKQVENSGWLVRQLLIISRTWFQRPEVVMKRGFCGRKGQKQRRRPGYGAFRHGPQEMVTEGAHFGLWIDACACVRKIWPIARDLSAWRISHADRPGWQDAVTCLPTTKSTA